MFSAVCWQHFFTCLKAPAILFVSYYLGLSCSLLWSPSMWGLNNKKVHVTDYKIKIYKLFSQNKREQACFSRKVQDSFTRPSMLWVRASLWPACLYPWARCLNSIAVLTRAYLGPVICGKCYNLSADGGACSCGDCGDFLTG